MAADLPNIAYPEWTEYRKKNGIDPLGMQTSSVSLYQMLMPGISNVTLRMRYYGLYAWLARTYAEQVGDTSPVQWQRCVRRAEALYALVAQRNGNETGVAGVTWAAAMLGEASDGEIDFAQDAEPGSPTHYLQQAWGAYGAAYATQLYNIGVFAETTEHGLPVPSAGIGDSIADAFGEALGPLGARMFAAIQSGSVSRRSLEELAPALPSAIASAGHERQCYENLLFAKAGLDRESDRSRKRSLQLILKLVQQLGSVPAVQDVRWQLYSAVNADTDSQNDAASDLSTQRRRWWVYQANDLTHICYETLLKYTLDRLEAHSDGVALGSLIAEVVAGLRGAAADWWPTWAAFVATHVPPAPDIEQRLSKDVMRAGRMDGACGPDDALSALRLLAVLCLRTHSARSTVHEQFKGLDDSAFHSLWTELTFLDQHVDDPLERFIARLIEQRIMRRHLWVAMRKLRYQGDYTFLIEADNGRVRLRGKDGPVFTNPRLAPAITFLKDILLIDKNGLTSDGRRVLAEA